jgi:hypothetical protein
MQVFNHRAGGKSELRIDAIAGSSAGSVTGLTLAQAIALNAVPDELERRMRACWVEGLNLVNLLEPADALAQAFFTDEALDRVADETLAQIIADGAVDVREAIALWITITNLDGIPYKISFGRDWTNEPVDFYALSYRDYSPYFICGRNIRYVSIPIEKIEKTTWGRCQEVRWDHAKASAIVSGAFPVAFRSHPVQRDPMLYPDYGEKFLVDPRVVQWLRSAAVVNPQGLQEQLSLFQCADGGIFNNEPIGRAVDAVAYLSVLDSSRRDDSRTYLIIEPEPSTGRFLDQRAARATSGDGDHGLHPVEELGKVVQAYFNDALYGDFAQAANVNRRLDNLAAAGRAHGLTPVQLDAVRRAVGLEHKQKIALDRIPWEASRDKAHGLAGAFAGHFGGFLRKEYREHDFILGLHEAREWMAYWLPAHLTSLCIPDADRLSIRSFLDEPLPSLPLLSPEPAWSSIPQPDKAMMVTEGGNRLEVLTKRWVPALGMFLPSIQKLMEPVVRSGLGAGPPSPPNWIGALRMLRGTAIGASMFRWGKKVFIVLALMLVAADLIGALAIRSQGWSAAFIAASFLGGVVLAVMRALDRWMRP